MFEQYRNRMARQGSNVSEMLRTQSNMVIEQTWERDPNFRRVYVVKVSNSLPKVTPRHNLVDVKFNVDTYQKAGSNEPSYYLQFRHGAEKYDPDIAIGSYVYMPDEDDEWKWWLIVGLDERPQFRQYHIAECNWELGWVADGKIYRHLGVLREGTSGDVDENSYTSTVDGTLTIWLPVTDDSTTIGYNQRFLISDARRTTPLAWEASRIVDTHPFGLMKLKMKQTTFDPVHDNAELMLANYYDTAIEPTEPDVAPEPSSTAAITYSGVAANIRVGGSFKTFTPAFSNEGTTVQSWVITDGDEDISSGTENYTIEYSGELLKIKVARNYNLIGRILTIQVVGTDGTIAKLSVEVIG